MKKILIYGDSNTWGFIPGSFSFSNNTASRFPRHQRWSGIVANDMGSNYEIIEEGLCGRTAILDDPFMPVMTNGKAYLLPCLISHYPLDCVIIMLGTNELKVRFGLSAFEITKGLRQLIWLIKSLPIGTINPSPKILIIAPPITIEGVGDWKEEFVGSAAKSKKLAQHYSEMCKTEKCHFLDAGQFAQSSIIDGIHLDSEGHLSLGKAVAKLLQQIF